MALFGTVALVAGSMLASFADAACESYGVDFQNGGTYFQNASSLDPFTFVQYFEGCQDDSSSNIFIDPHGNEYLCSSTPLTPDDVNQQSTCPITKNDLYSGPWSIIIASNNGNAAAIAFERDFSLVVGIPSTITCTPTITVTSISTPLITTSITTISTSTATTTETVTSPSVTVEPTTTITPAAVTTTLTSTTYLGLTDVVARPIVTIIRRSKTCSVPPSQSTPDTTASISPTLLSSTVQARYALPSPRVRPRELDLAVLRGDRERWLVERQNRLAAADKLGRRGLDKATTTVTDSNTADFKTSTLVVVGTSTIFVTTTIESTAVLTESTVTTALSGTTTLSQITITAPTPTLTKTIEVIDTTVITTITQSPLITITVARAPASATSSCHAEGGKLV